jgi:hypothetical protein
VFPAVNAACPDAAVKARQVYCLPLEGRLTWF